MYGEVSATADSVGTVTATPSIQIIPESVGPAPPTRRSISAFARMPRLCRSVISSPSVEGTSLIVVTRAASHHFL